LDTISHIFVITVHLFRKVAELIDTESNTIRETEVKTLHGSPGFTQSDFGIDEPSWLARLLDDILGHLYGHIRHLSLIESFIDFIEMQAPQFKTHSKEL
jgi:hypothetical protein